MTIVSKTQQFWRNSAYLYLRSPCAAKYSAVAPELTWEQKCPWVGLYTHADQDINSEPVLIRRKFGTRLLRTLTGTLRS